jgi:HPr Serine kinase C-terminal domain
MSDGFLCGWRVRSELDLPELAPWSGDDRPPDVVIRFGDVPDRLDDLIEDGPFLQIDRRATCLLRLDNVAAYLVNGPGEVVVSPRPGAKEVEIRVFLLASVLGLLCHLRGLLPLHASCVAVDGKAVALCGASGMGKSTAAAQLTRRGHRLLADDVCAIDAHAAGGPRVLPSFPRLKLWRDALDALEIPCGRLERNRPGQNKYHHLQAEAFCAAAIPLSKILVLRFAFPSMAEESLELSRPAQKVAALNAAVFRPQAASALGRTEALLAAHAAVAGSTPIWRLTRRFDLSDMDRGFRPIEALLAS